MNAMSALLEWPVEASDAIGLAFFSIAGAQVAEKAGFSGLIVVIMATITGSFGVTSSVQSGYSLARLLSHADRQLYRAKHLGRNRVCVYENESEAVRAASNVLELPQRERSEHLGA